MLRLPEPFLIDDDDEVPLLFSSRFFFFCVHLNMRTSNKIQMQSAEKSVADKVAEINGLRKEKDELEEQLSQARNQQTIMPTCLPAC